MKGTKRRRKSGSNLARICRPREGERELVRTPSVVQQRGVPHASVRESLSKCARASSIQEGCCEVPTRRADQRPVPTEPKVSAELIGRRSKEAATPYNAKRASSAASLLLSLALLPASSRCSRAMDTSVWWSLFLPSHHHHQSRGTRAVRVERAGLKINAGVITLSHAGSLSLSLAG